MTTVEIEGDTLVITIKGLDRIWALKSRLELPLEHVVGARRADGAEKFWKGWRVGGTDLPGVIAAGRFHEHGEAVFWDVHHPEKAVEIEVRDERLARLVIEVDDPDSAVALVQGALGERARGA